VLRAWNRELALKQAILERFLVYFCVRNEGAVGCCRRLVSDFLFSFAVEIGTA
jgi:hypothetical protein